MVQCGWVNCIEEWDRTPSNTHRDSPPWVTFDKEECQARKKGNRLESAVLCYYTKLSHTTTVLSPFKTEEIAETGK